MQPADVEKRVSSKVRVRIINIIGYILQSLANRGAVLNRVVAISHKAVRKFVPMIGSRPIDRASRVYAPRLQQSEVRAFINGNSDLFAEFNLPR